MVVGMAGDRGVLWKDGGDRGSALWMGGRDER